LISTLEAASFNMGDMKKTVMRAAELSVVQILVSVTGCAVDDWEDLDGPGRLLVSAS